MAIESWNQTVAFLFYKSAYRVLIFGLRLRRLQNLEFSGSFQASGFIPAQSDNFVVLAKLKFCKRFFFF
jgi:hypothetical protein